MWGHHANNHRGFVVAFDTSHRWFSTRKDGQKNRLQRVKYFDGKLDEPLNDIQAAFISKLTDWSDE